MRFAVRLWAAFRGYGRDEELFHHFPEHVTWHFAEFEPEDLYHIRYIDYSYWMRSPEIRLYRLTLFRQSVKTAAFDVPNDRFLKGERFLREGGKFPPGSFYLLAAAVSMS